MGGKGALGVWLKEFCSLVFTQTLQAFIYAIIITMILLSALPVEDQYTGDDINSSVGLMATFALLSVFKVEEMSKKIFGISDTKASPGNAMKSLAKTAVAVQLGKRVLNNVGKVTGGIRAITKSRQDNAKAKKRLDEDMEDNGFVMGENGIPNYVGKSSTGSRTSSPTVPRTAPSGGNQTVNIPAPSTNDVDINVPSLDVSGPVISDAANRRMKNALRQYEDKLSEIKKAREEGIKSIFSGVTEGVGSIVGGATGALIAGADGNIDEAIRGLMSGAGVGDKIAESTINSLDKATKFVQRQVNHKPGISSKELQRSIDAYKDALNNANINYGSANVDEIE